MKRSLASSSSSSSPPTNARTTTESCSSTPPKQNDSESNNSNNPQQCRTPKRKMISLKSLMSSLHCSPIKPINTNNISGLYDSNEDHVVASSNNCTRITTSISNADNNQISNRNQETHLTPPLFPVSDELDRKLMPSPRKKITLRVKSSPKNSTSSSSGTTTPAAKHHDNTKTPLTIHSTSVADSCSSSDYHRSSTAVESPCPSQPVVENIPMDQVVGFFFLYESHESLKQATYCQVVPLRKGKSLISRKGADEVIRNKKLPSFDHWICIDRTYISRVHALVEVSNGEFVFVEDLSSSNSTHIVEKTEKRKINVNIESNKLYQLRDNYILFGKLLCQYREKSELSEQSVSEAMQVYYKSCNATKTPQKPKKTPQLTASRDGSQRQRMSTIPETPEFNRPSKLPSIRDKIVPPTVYADRTSKTSALAFETPKRIQECLKTQQSENPILSIEQTPPSISKPSSSTSSGFVTPSNVVIVETPSNGSSNDKKDSPQASDQSDHLNLTDIDLSSLSLPDELFEDIEEHEEKKQESTLEDEMLEDEIVLTDYDDEEENERKRSFEDEEESFIAPKKKKLKAKKSDHQSPHILFTGISPTEENIKAIERLGGVLVEEPEAELLASRLTHLITDKIRRFVFCF